RTCSGGCRSPRTPGEPSPWDPRHAYHSADKDDVFGIGFEQVRCQVARFMTHLLSSLVHGRAAMLHGARADGARAALDGVGVGMDEAHRLEWHAQLLRRDLGE